METTFKYLTVELRGDLSWVIINRPQDRNSINSALMTELVMAIDEMEKGPSRAIVFTGAGKDYFIGGADGVEMMRLNPAEAKDFSTRIQSLFNRLEASRLITVAAINGLCFGGGYEFALACDLRLAGPSARIGLPEVKVGLIPGGGGTQRLPRLVGLGRALEIILSGRLYKAAEAAELGLIHLAVGKDELESGVTKLLTPILRQPQYALSLAKSAVYAFQSGSLDNGLQVESDCFSQCFEQTYFVDLMNQQIDEGVLTTTEDISKINKETT